MITVYGIPNCDTVKRARAWLTAQGREHTFHDFKRQGVPPDRLDAWAAALGWVDAASARALMLAQASVIKRPVVEWGDGVVTVGFDEAAWVAKVG
jgi:arsenate reductase